ncbi:hypothetical protein MT355_04115 [Rathayibacter sp. VKM Ac-2929]|uniref:hypothetical protein n=1 Tax=Rathayibacter sp. VKM Ac-2929 TaxID=2929480 RepID=UPI001FB35C3C|nr:hypothetical protein [Rathayibacter sp. VKM Ac-2929]MCJ1672431.1 hypothetical protein [Rathayibacter sp. VKM Ac-2929]
MVPVMKNSEQPADRRKQEPTWRKLEPWSLFVLLFVGTFCGNTVADAVGATDPWDLLVKILVSSIVVLIICTLLNLRRDQRR